MILDEKILINCVKNKKLYKSLGYDVSSTYIEIDPVHLPKSSHVIINVKCDVCGTEKQLKYYQYYINTEGLSEEYCCSKKCSSDKTKRRLQNKYGVDNVFQLNEIKDKTKNTLNRKYGEEHPMRIDSIVDKLKRTNNQKYGHDHGLSNINIQEKIENTNLLKYGYRRPLLSEDIRKKAQHTFIFRYGTNHPMREDSIVDKLKRTNLLRYGVENVFMSKSIKDKIKKTHIMNHGVDNPQKNIKTRNKTIKTNTSKYGYLTPSKNISVKNKIIKSINDTLFDKNTRLYKDKYDLDILNYCDSTKEYTINCPSCGKEFNIQSRLLQQRINLNTILCVECNPISRNISGLEKELLDFVKINYGGVVITNSKKIIPPYELDIYIPELKLSFEFNGLYWHSEIYKDKNYHYNKTTLCKNKGIQLVHIWEDDWVYKKDILKSMILNKLLYY